MKVLAIIPARGGSKGILKKNLRLLDDKLLIAFAIEAAQSSRLITRFVVSTDDHEIAEASKTLGADVPFMRPASLASDSANQVDVAIHALQMIENLDNTRYDVVLLLQPTSPLRTSKDIDEALGLFNADSVDSVASFCRVEQGHPYYMYIIEHGQPRPLLDIQSATMRRQEFPPVYLRNGAIYAVSREIILNRHTFYGSFLRAYIMPYVRSVNIDTEDDLAYAEFLLVRTHQQRKMIGLGE